MKTCSKCKILLSLNNFHKDKSKKSGYRALCKKCIPKYWNTEKQKQYKLRYYKSERGIQVRIKFQNSLKRKEYQKKYAQKYQQSLAYKSKSRERAKRLKKWRLTSKYRDYLKRPEVVIRNSLRARMHKALKGKQKNCSTLKTFGCSIQELKSYIEKQFRDGMDWNNYGEWHIDHIRPLASFDLADEQQRLKACHYSNLQPLWAWENFQKGSRIIF